MAIEMITHRGGCHCGAVSFEVEAPAEIEATECNCSICRMAGYQHLIVPASRFRLLSSRAALTTYEFNTRAAKHYFCSRCGVKSFYVPRSNTDGYSVNVRCLEPESIAAIRVKPFDGEHWEKNAGELRHLSKE